MFDMFVYVLLDAALDTVKLIPFLFLTYLIMEWFEHRSETKTQSAILKAGRLGPLVGGLIGVVPQCGFSAAASSLYSGGMITAGALVAVFLSTSDEMLPIFISEAVPVLTMIIPEACSVCLPGSFLYGISANVTPCSCTVPTSSSLFMTAA